MPESGEDDDRGNLSYDRNVLAELELTVAELGAVARQGFVSSEARNGRVRFKLRFRLDRKQRVLCLGADSVFAVRVREELRRLQTPRRQELESERALRRAKQVLRESKRVAAPVLAARGYRFHGYAVRRSRDATETVGLCSVDATSFPRAS